jgi:anti-sigma factor RsiW
MMSSLLQQLENNEAVLLMYQAGELPDADRAEVEQMLAADPALRRALAEMTSLHDHMTSMLSQADSALHLSRREAAVRQVSLAINQAKAESRRAPAPVLQPARSRARIPVWAYPVAAAAMLVIGIMVFNHKQPPGTTPGGEGVPVAIVIPAPPDGPVAIIPAATSDDSLARLEKEVLSLGSNNGNDLDLFSANPDADHQ